MKVIVKRGALRRFDKLKQKTAGMPVEVEWDRRVGERRSAKAAIPANRRSTDRRQPPPFTWQTADFVIVLSRRRSGQ